MEIPKVIIKMNRRYKLIKEYPGFILYQDVETGTKEAFKRSDLGMVQEIIPKPKMPFHRKNGW